MGSLPCRSEQDPSVVYLETATDSLHLEKSAEIQTYSLRFNRVVATALSPQESIEHLKDLADHLRK
ncbi:Scr1 family TA system antitoxin-like transcriptional regulator [Streptosporangium carneum]|uniref:Scr1 family TA system antitoxin-like transcriptional regulator n=1 Tax=Streptosporangium carneum TaxID=47481 RepID=UPI0034D984FF